MSIACVVIGNWVLFEVSNEQSITTIVSTSRYSIPVMILNYITVAATVLIVLCITRHIWVACYVSTSINMLFSVANHYTIKFHGMPISINDLKNIKTAADVAGNYNYGIDRCLLKLLIIYLICMFICFVAYSYDKKVNASIYISLAICVVLIIFGYHSQWSIKPKQVIKWHWYEAYKDYGAPACTYESFVQNIFFNPVVKPEGYAAEEIENIKYQKIKLDKEEYPDIILILNETFYDLDQITDTKTNSDFLKNINSSTNISKGYAVVPLNGGGTNCSEYELLTSNSMYLLPNVTPFVSLDLKNHPSIVSYLKSMGYYTIASHPASEINYNRKNGYPDLGFDEIHFTDDFENNEFIFSRTYENDNSAYKNMIKWNESVESNTPVFSYMLTIQNHGEWNFNTTDEHVVKAATDYHELDEQVDEYLTCIQYSDQAWKELVDYYEKSDRKAIICMMGDHSPHFAKEICSKGSSDEEKEILLRKVPLLIWDNFSDKTQDLGMISMNYVIPTLLEYAGLPLAPYYDYMLELKKEVPVITSYGTYITADQELHSLEENIPYKAKIQKYFHLEYNNITEKDHKFKKEWFYLLLEQ